MLWKYSVIFKLKITFSPQSPLEDLSLLLHHISTIIHIMEDNLVFYRVLSEENILNIVCKTKNLHIPREVHIWIWFKRYYLEKKENRDRISLCKTEQEFRETFENITPTKVFP